MQNLKSLVLISVFIFTATPAEGSNDYEVPLSVVRLANHSWMLVGGVKDKKPCRYIMDKE
jgi:hypothetical protein